MKATPPCLLRGDLNFISLFQSSFIPYVSVDHARKPAPFANMLVPNLTSLVHPSSLSWQDLCELQAPCSSKMFDTCSTCCSAFIHWSSDASSSVRCLQRQTSTNIPTPLTFTSGQLRQIRPRSDPYDYFIVRPPSIAASSPLSTSSAAINMCVCFCTTGTGIASNHPGAKQLPNPSSSSSLRDGDDQLWRLGQYNGSLFFTHAWGFGKDDEDDNNSETGWKILNWA